MQTYNNYLKLETIRGNILSKTTLNSGPRSNRKHRIDCEMCSSDGSTCLPS